MKQLTSVTKGNTPSRNWHLIDLKNQTLGRVATTIASLLVGKHKVAFSSHRDDGDYVVAINAKDIRVTGKKNIQKLYQTHSGYPGGLKELKLKELMAKDPRRVIVNAVKGMIPKNKLRSLRISRLKVFVNENHSFNDKFSTK